MVAVVHSDGNVSRTHRLSHLRAGKNHVFHLGAPELFCALFSEHPPDRIRHIAFSASVGTNNSRDAAVKFKNHFVGEGFKSIHFNAFQIHSYLNIPSLCFIAS